MGVERHLLLEFDDAKQGIGSQCCSFSGDSGLAHPLDLWHAAIQRSHQFTQMSDSSCSL